LTWSAAFPEMTVSAPTIRPSVPETAARHHGPQPEWPPLFLGDWMRVLFIHYEVDAKVLQCEVPFELDLWDGRALVSLVAFTMRRLRPGFGGWLGEMLFKPISTTRFLNVRAYVRHRNEPGIYFITEFLSNRLCVPLGPLTFGLPYQAGKLAYREDCETGVIEGLVRDARDRGRLSFKATLPAPAEFHLCQPGSLDAFLLERYTAFTRCGNKRRLFRIRHQPWAQTRTDIVVHDDGLFASTGKWASSARLVGANFSPGARNVWMGRARRIHKPATRRRLTVFFED
jgi:uncharacterized protein YqjF (DUF2071 family)